LRISEIYDLLYVRYGDLGWWPASSDDEVVIGAVLTQNTSWKNVEIALNRLKERRLLGIEEIYNSPEDEIRDAIRSSGFYNRKAMTLKLLSKGIVEKFGSIEGMKGKPAQIIINFLESIHGIGAETRDDIMLYALGMPVFIVDSYTERIFKRLSGLEDAPIVVSRNRPKPKNHGLDKEQLKNFHAMLVHTAKEYCRKTPLCSNCPLNIVCAFARGTEKQ